MSTEVLAESTKPYKSKPRSWGATQHCHHQIRPLGLWWSSAGRISVCHGQGPGLHAQPVVTLAAHSAVDGHGLVPHLCWWGNAAANAGAKAEHQCNSFVCVGLLPNSGTAGLDCSYELNFLRNCHAVSITTVHPTSCVRGLFLRSLASIRHIAFWTMVTLAGRRRCCNVVLIFIFLVVKTMQHDTVRVRILQTAQGTKCRHMVLHQIVRQRVRKRGRGPRRRGEM